MSLISRLEARFGRYAVPNVTAMIIAGQVLCYFADLLSAGPAQAGILDSIQLVPQKVAEGEIWRVITYLFDPPRTNPIFAFFAWYLFYLMGSTLESTWGSFRYNAYLLIGYLASLALAFGSWMTVGAAGGVATNLFLYGSVFLAFARLYPDFTLMLFFILPVKVKWLAMLMWLTFAWTLVMSPFWIEKAMVIAAVLNYLIFFGRDMIRDAKQGHRRMQHQSRAKKSSQRLVHQCRVCGLNSTDAPRTQFRYCTQCEGQCCYCPDHLRNHEHVVSKSA